MHSRQCPRGSAACAALLVATRLAGTDVSVPSLRWEASRKETLESPKERRKTPAMCNEFFMVHKVLKKRKVLITTAPKGKARETESLSKEAIARSTAALLALARSTSLSNTIDAKLSAACMELKSLIVELTQSHSCDELVECQAVQSKVQKAQKLTASHKAWTVKHTVTTYQAFQKAYAAACESLNDSVPDYIHAAMCVRATIQEAIANNNAEEALKIMMQGSVINGRKYSQESLAELQDWTFQLAMEAHLNATKTQRQFWDR